MEVLRVVLFLCVGACLAKIRVTPHQRPARLLTLPSNATSIREEITDTFSCEGMDYGYYADVDNDCQLFHVCLPVTYPDGNNQTFKWSFICPEETMFNQESFTCTRPEDAIPCAESPSFYSLNSYIGQTDKEEELESSDGAAEQQDMNTLEQSEQAAMQRTSRLG